MIVTRTGQILLAAFLVAFLAPSPLAWAQLPAEEEPGPLEFARERLNLDAGQQRELRALLFDTTARLQEISDRYAALVDGGSQVDKLREVRDLQQDFRTRLSALLTPDQLSEWDRIGEELRAHAREHWPAAGGL